QALPFWGGFEAGERRPSRKEEAVTTRQRAGRSEGQRSWTRRPNPLAPTKPSLLVPAGLSMGSAGRKVCSDLWACSTRRPDDYRRPTGCSLNLKFLRIRVSHSPTLPSPAKTGSL